MSLLTRIHNECIFTHYEPTSKTVWANIDFGADEVDRMYLFLGCTPGEKQTDIRSLLVPTSHRPQQMTQGIKPKDLPLTFEHYVLTKDKLRAAFRGLQSLEPDALNVLDELFVKYEKPSAIYTNLRGQGVLIGEQMFLQEVMRYIKQDVTKVQELSELLLNKPSHSMPKTSLVLDSCEEPREVCFWNY